MAPRQRSPTPQDDDTPSSSPPIMTRKRIEEESTASSTSSLTPESEIARDKHDIFNLFALVRDMCLLHGSSSAQGQGLVVCHVVNGVLTSLLSFLQLPVVLLTIVNYDWGKVTSELNPKAAWTGEYFMEYWSATMLYFIVDLLWVAWVPICVKSPNVIIKVRTLLDSIDRFTTLIQLTSAPPFS